MTRLTLNQWYAALKRLRTIYPDWDRYDEKTRKQLANRHGYPYHVKENSPRGIFTKTFYGTAAQVDQQNINWQNMMIRQYRTFHVLNATDRPIPRGFFRTDYELTVTYRI